MVRRVLLGVILVLGGVAPAFRANPPSRPISGTVISQGHPIGGARVRYQGHGDCVLTDRTGHFELKGEGRNSSRLTAWKSGFAIGATPLDQRPWKLDLLPLPRADNPDYQWVDPAPDARQPHNCGNCHEEIQREWASSAHARSATNRRVRSLLAGTDWTGRPSANWSLKHEHPLGAAVCATCHAPTYRDPTLEYDLERATGVAARGVHCDFCHKIAAAPTDRLGRQFGRDGYQLLRPVGQEQLFFGPLEDAYRVGEKFAHAPFYRESRYCASCHEGIVFGVPVYSTYSEWLASPAQKRGQQCQTCHMTPTGKMTNIAPRQGGIERAPGTLASHRLLGAQEEMLRRCLTLEARAIREPGGVRLEVTVRTQNVGHRVPTGFIDRNLLLVVEALNQAGQRVALQDGPKLPLAAGQAHAGFPGWLYARQLLDETGKGPRPFWVPGLQETDTRLHPEQSDRRIFRFPTSATHFRARLLYRRFWPEVSRNKGWPSDEVEVARVTR